MEETNYNETDEKKTESVIPKEKKLLRSALAAISIPLMLCVVIPFEIFCGNIKEMRFSVGMFLPVCLLFFVIVSGIIFLFLYLVPKKVFNIAYPLTVGACFMFFLQGLILNFGINSLAGDNVGLSSVSKDASVVNTVIWVLVVSAFVIVYNLKIKGGNSVMKAVCLIITVSVIGTQIINFSTLSLATDGAYLSIFERNRLDDPDCYPYMLSYDNITDISNDRNVFVFVVDRFDRVFADVALKSDPDLFSELEGFTYYRDTVSLYGHTYPSVPYMVTGVRYNGEYREDYLNGAFENASPLEELKSNGYEINFYTDSYYGYTYDHHISKYISNVRSVSSDIIRTKNSFLLGWNMIKMGLFRVLPHFAKSLVSDITSRSCNDLIYYENGDEELSEYSTDLGSLEEFYRMAKFEFTDKKVFSFIHTDGCHDLYYGGGDDPDDVCEEDIKDTSVTLGINFDIINKYLIRLKDAGLYKDSTIIITGDHGSALDDSLPLDGVRTTALFVKPSGADSGKISVSSAQIWHEDLWATIFDSEGISASKDYGRPVYEIREDEDRTRTYYWHKAVELENGDYIFTEEVYAITGSALDFNNWKLTSEKVFDRYLYD